MSHFLLYTWKSPAARTGAVRRPRPTELFA
jgi:hypothetical protein